MKNKVKIAKPAASQKTMAVSAPVAESATVAAVVAVLVEAAESAVVVVPAVVSVVAAESAVALSVAPRLASSKKILLEEKLLLLGSSKVVSAGNSGKAGWANAAPGKKINHWLIAINPTKTNLRKIPP